MNQMRRRLNKYWLIILVGLCGCEGGMLDPAGPVANAERLLLFDATAVMLVIILPTIAATLIFAWWFRAKNKKAKRRPDWQYSGRVELLVWSIPALAVMFLGGMAWVSSHQLDPARPLNQNSQLLEVQAVALDWRWLFIYPQQNIASINYMALPSGKPVQVRITSASVMNMFLVPQLAGGMMAMNGMVTEVNLQANKTGKYHGLSGQYSGARFADMNFTVDVMTQEGFDNWVKSAKTSSGLLNEEGYNQLSKQTHDTKNIIFGAVTPELFQAIIGHKLLPGPGPENPDAR